MCGIAVTINGNWQETTKMTQAQSRRGLSHSFHDAGHGVRVGFNHLPITGNFPQPFVGKKYKVWFNGFISNHRELTEWYRLPSETGTDTECLGHFIDQDLPLSELNGFFALFILNRETGQWSAHTDRHGIKQLYQYIDHDNRTTYIASEVKSLLAVIPDILIQPPAVFDWQYSLGVLTPNTIFKGITRIPKLPPPHLITSTDTYDQAVDNVARLIGQAMKRNQTTLKSGVFLSGGIDSGAIAKIIQPDYCLSFDYQEPDLSEIAGIKAQSVGTHLTMIHNSETFNRFAPPCLDALDDLKAGPCYTNYALTELASQVGVRVLYSGAGADELFRGYTHRYAKPIHEVMRRTSIHPPTDQPLMISHEAYDYLYLQGILIVEDRMSGAFAIETRYPYLDKDLVDYVRSLPAHYKLNDKQLLRDATLMEKRKKKGFVNPITNDFWVNYAYGHIRDKYTVPSV